MGRLAKFIGIVLLLFVLFGLIGVYVAGYSFNVVDHLNLWYEKSNKVDEVDRIVYIKAAVDQDYIDICSREADFGLFFEDGSFSFVRKWTVEERVGKIIARASKSFEYQFGIKLVLVEVEEWDSQSYNSLALYRELRKEIPLDNCDVVIGFTGRATDLTCRGEMPSGGHLGNYIVEGFHTPTEIKWISYIFNTYHLQAYTLTHELGHIFGAVHPEEEYGFAFSVMNFVTGCLTTHFDKYNKEIILQNKYLPFK